MGNQKFMIEGMTIAVTNMKAMLNFYSAVFDIDFEEKEMFNAKLYAGKWGMLNLLFCPAEIARNTAKQNRHQFDIVVSDLDQLIALATKNGGKLMGSVQEDESSKSIGIYDPDENSILFKELK